MPSEPQKIPPLIHLDAGDGVKPLCGQRTREIPPLTSDTTQVTCRKCYLKLESCYGDDVQLRLAQKKARERVPRTREGLAEATYYRANPKTHIGDKTRPGLTYCGRDVAGLWSDVVPWDEAEGLQKEHPAGVDWCRNCLDGRFAKPKSKTQKTRELKEGVRPH